MCELYSTACGADYWLEFSEADPPEHQALNGKCVVVVGSKGDLRETDEYDPLGKNEYDRLWVDKSKLKREET